MHHVCNEKTSISKNVNRISSVSLCHWQNNCAEAVSCYEKQLHEQNHPLFVNNVDCPHFTKTSLRKYHVERLSDAAAPLIVQQASLAQNVKSYARGAHTLDEQMKVAKVVSGNQINWHHDMQSEKKPSLQIHKNNKSFEILYIISNDKKQYLILSFVVKTKM